MKQHRASFQLLLVKLPLRNNPDKAIANSFDEFTRRKAGGPHSLGDALAYIGLRAPQLRIEFAKTHSHKGSTVAP